MKKLSLILVLLLAVGLAAFAGEPSVSGTLGSQINFDDDPASLGNIGKLRLNVSIPVGDFVNVTMDLRNDENKVVDDGTNTIDGFSFNQVYATTDLSGIFGISDMVSLTLTMGNYEQWMSNWNSVISSNRTRNAVEFFAIGGSDESPDVGLDIGVGDFGTLMTYLQTANGSDDLAYKFGFKLGPVVDGLNAIVSYSGADGTSYMKLEAGYTYSFGDGMAITVPAAFIMDLENDFSRWFAGVKFTGFGLSAAVQVSGVTDFMFSLADFQLAYAVMETGLSVYMNGFMCMDDDVTPDFLEALDFGISYDLGGNMMYVGYVADLGDLPGIVSYDGAGFALSDTPLMMDDSTGRHGITGDGFYIASVINF